MLSTVLMLAATATKPGASVKQIKVRAITASARDGDQALCVKLRAVTSAGDASCRSAGSSTRALAARRWHRPSEHHEPRCWRRPSGHHDIIRQQTHEEVLHGKGQVARTRLRALQSPPPLQHICITSGAGLIQRAQTRPYCEAKKREAATSCAAR